MSSTEERIRALVDENLEIEGRPPPVARWISIRASGIPGCRHWILWPSPSWWHKSLAWTSAWRSAQASIRLGNS